MSWIDRRNSLEGVKAFEAGAKRPSRGVPAECSAVEWSRASLREVISGAASNFGERIYAVPAMLVRIRVR